MVEHGVLQNLGLATRVCQMVSIGRADKGRRIAQLSSKVKHVINPIHSKTMPLMPTIATSLVLVERQLLAISMVLLPSQAPTQVSHGFSVPCSRSLDSLVFQIPYKIMSTLFAIFVTDHILFCFESVISLVSM